MKYFGLVWAGLWRKKTRTVFTMISIVIAFLLFGLLQGINQGFGTAHDATWTWIVCMSRRAPA